MIVGSIPRKSSGHSPEAQAHYDAAARLIDRLKSCRCDHAEQALGFQDGINMGRGVVRTTTHPRCPVHALCQHYTSQVRGERSNGRWLQCPVHGSKACPPASVIRRTGMTI